MGEEDRSQVLELCVFFCKRKSRVQSRQPTVSTHVSGTAGILPAYLIPPPPRVQPSPLHALQTISLGNRLQYPQCKVLNCREYTSLPSILFQNCPERSNAISTRLLPQFTINLHCYPASDSFLWLLLDEDYDTDLDKILQRAWYVDRLVDSVKLQLSELNLQLHELLLSF